MCLSIILGSDSSNISSSSKAQVALTTRGAHKRTTRGRRAEEGAEGGGGTYVACVRSALYVGLAMESSREPGWFSSKPLI